MKYWKDTSFGVWQNFGNISFLSCCNITINCSWQVLTFLKNIANIVLAFSFLVHGHCNEAKFALETPFKWKKLLSVGFFETCHYTWLAFSIQYFGGGIKKSKIISNDWKIEHSLPFCCSSANNQLNLRMVEMSKSREKSWAAEKSREPVCQPPSLMSQVPSAHDATARGRHQPPHPHSWALLMQL